MRIIAILRTMGWKWVFWRGLYTIFLKSGWGGIRTNWWISRQGVGVKAVLSRKTMEELKQGVFPLFFRASRKKQSLAPGPSEAGQWHGAEARADSFLGGAIPAFDGSERFAGALDWFMGQDGTAPWPSGIPWYRVPDLSPDMGDIKYVWEKSRFTWAFALAQAFKLRKDERYAEAFWLQFEDWEQRNQYGCGPNWRCGQETALRAMALCYALDSFSHSPSATCERLQKLILSIWFHGQHIKALHWYAEHCVRNNHSISEAVALITIGHVCPLLKEAGEWKRTGCKWLTKEVDWQIFEDGTYVQQSNNYSRFVGQLLTWVLAMGVNREDSCTGFHLVEARARKLWAFLYSQMDARTGYMPNFGANDGALIFPWSISKYRDFRPFLNSLSLALGDGGLPGQGEWEEEAFWFGLLDPSRQNVEAGVEGMPREGLMEYPSGGISVLKVPGQLVLFRCGPNRHRPLQADMMHVDYWVHGFNILMDPGTFQYNTSPEYLDYFSGSRGHNSLILDDQEQMQRGGRFLWLNWVQGQVTGRDVRSDQISIVGQHEAFFPWVHERAVSLTSQGLVVKDKIFGGTGTIPARLHWLVNDLSFTMEGQNGRFALPDGRSVGMHLWCNWPLDVQVIKNDQRRPAGVISEHYGALSGAVSVIASTQGADLEFRTVISLSDVPID